MKTKSKMDLLAHLIGNDHAGKANKAGAAASARGAKEAGGAAPDFSGMLSGLMKSQLGTGKVQGQAAENALTKHAVSTRGETEKRSESTRVSKETDHSKEKSETTGEQPSMANMASALLALAQTPQHGKQAAQLETAQRPAAPQGTAIEVQNKPRDLRAALMGGDLALALASITKGSQSPKSQKDEKADALKVSDKADRQDASLLFEKPAPGMRSAGAHGVLDKSQAELTHPKTESLAALSGKKDSDSAEDAKAKTRSQDSHVPDTLRFELPVQGEAKLTATSAPTQIDVRSEVLAPDPTAGDLNIRGGVQGQTAKLLIDAGQGIGELELHLRVRQGVASVRIEGEGAAAMIAGRTDELRRSVESQGLTLGSVEISRPAADAPVSNASNLMHARSEQREHSDGRSQERMETRLEDGTVRGQPARLSQSSTRTRTGDGSVDVQA